MEKSRAHRWIRHIPEHRKKYEVITVNAIKTVSYPWHQMEVSGQLHVAAALPTGKNAGTSSITRLDDP